VRILLADDHTLIRENLRDFLQTLDTDVSIFEAATLQEAEETASRQSSLDLIILDLMMPGMNGLKGIQHMVEKYTGIPVVILSGSVIQENILGALDFGARGFIPKTIGGKAMLSALRLILSGETYVPTQALAGAGERLGDETISKEEGNQAGPLKDLTDRERDVLSLLVKGHPNKIIARELGLKEVTVKVYLQAVYRKLGVSNRAQAVGTALGLGWEQ